MEADPAHGTSPNPGELGAAERRWATIAAILALGFLGGTLTWWTLKEGGYFGRVMYPGVGLLGLGLILLLATAPRRAVLRVPGLARVGIYGLLALGAWSLASALWSPTPDIAVQDAQRIVGYAIFFVLGIWACALLRHRMELAMLPLVVAAAIAAIAALVTLAFADAPLSYLEEDGTLQYPLGYRNANAAFFLVALWPALALAGSPRVAKAIRVGAFVAATACIQIALLSQSRGSIIGAGAAIVVYLLAARNRLAALAWLLLAILPAAPTVLDSVALFDAAKVSENLESAVDEMNSAGASGLVRLAVAAVVCLVALWIEPRIRISHKVGNRVLAAAVVVMAVGVVAATGNPITWAGDRATEFFEGEPDLSESSSRLTLNAGSNRSEIWRVSVEASGDDPIFGLGGGGFQFYFNRERDDPGQLARDAHSVELEMLTELGVVGLALFAIAMVGAFGAAIRARKLGPAAAQLSCGALAAGAYWLAHASIDWFWPYPAVTAGALALLGAASGPSLLTGAARPGGRRALIAGIGVFIALLVPPMLSELLVERSFDTFRTDPDQAYEDLDLARDLNPLSDQPALSEGAIALALDDRERSIAAFREAIREHPEEYAGHYFLAKLFARTDPDQARAELAAVEELNPLEPKIDAIRRQIEATEEERP